jgi:putative FmdB family regulatory protein
MPLYEYECQQCKHIFEKLVTDHEPAVCPQCNGRRLERLLSLPGRPVVRSSSLPMTCKSSGPPCGPQCPRS